MRRSAASDGIPFQSKISLLSPKRRIPFAFLFFQPFLALATTENHDLSSTVQFGVEQKPSS
jgi:hypothetical protein